MVIREGQEWWDGECENYWKFRRLLEGKGLEKDIGRT